MKTRILTIGTASVSTLIRCDGIPRPGCTVTAERYSIRPGGRAVISSVAISKLGGDSIVCSSVGEDSYAVMLEDFLGSFCVDRRFYVKKNGRKQRILDFIRCFLFNGGKCFFIERISNRVVAFDAVADRSGIVLRRQFVL